MYYMLNSISGGIGKLSSLPIVLINRITIMTPSVSNGNTFVYSSLQSNNITEIPPGTLSGLKSLTLL